MIEKLVAKHGEENRLLIVDALKFLDDHEPTWGLDIPIDREEYIEDIMEKVAR